MLPLSSRLVFASTVPVSSIHATQIMLGTALEMFAKQSSWTLAGRVIADGIGRALRRRPMKPTCSW